MAGMKVSVSLPEDDVTYLDSYARSQGIESRSAVLHKAVGLLRASELEDSYADAWASWDSSADAEAWDSAAADGIAS
jgi:Arc/MetJ-type ribon-helix-helix transcriptional regulator